MRSVSPELLVGDRVAGQTELPSTQRHRIFGEDGGDEDGDLCAPMIQVVLDLFDGVDYDDPEPTSTTTARGKSVMRGFAGHMGVV